MSCTRRVCCKPENNTPPLLVARIDARLRAEQQPHNRQVALVARKMQRCPILPNSKRPVSASKAQRAFGRTVLYQRRRSRTPGRAPARSRAAAAATSPRAAAICSAAAPALPQRSTGGGGVRRSSRRTSRTRPSRTAARSSAASARCSIPKRRCCALGQLGRRRELLSLARRKCHNSLATVIDIAHAIFRIECKCGKGSFDHYLLKSSSSHNYFTIIAIKCCRFARRRLERRRIDPVEVIHIDFVVTKKQHRVGLVPQCICCVHLLVQESCALNSHR